LPTYGLVIEELLLVTRFLRFRKQEREESEKNKSKIEKGKTDEKKNMEPSTEEIIGDKQNQGMKIQEKTNEGKEEKLPEGYNDGDYEHGKHKEMNQALPILNPSWKLVEHMSCNVYDRTKDSDIYEKFIERAQILVYLIDICKLFEL